MWHDPLLWTLVCLAARAGVVTFGYWSAATAWRSVVDGRPGENVARPAARWLARGAYLLGIPLLALSLRVAPPSDLGLRAPASGASVVTAVGATLLTLIALAAARWRPDRSSSPRDSIPWWRPTVPAMAALAVDGVWLEAHYALFRAGSLSLTGGAVTPAVFLSLGLLAIEAWSDPVHRIALSEPRTATCLSAGAAAAVTSALAFALTGSSLCAGVCQTSLRIGLAGLPGGADALGAGSRRATEAGAGR